MNNFTHCKTRSCGDCGTPIVEWNKSGYCKACRNRHRPLPPYDMAYAAGYRGRRQAEIARSNARQRAKRDGVPFEITADGIRNIPDGCQCCGKVMVRGGEWHEQPSLDKIVPQKGYVPGNTAWICRRCNQAKGNATLDELRLIVSYLEVSPSDC